MTDFDQRMARLIGNRALVGITYVESDGERRIQMHGVISRGVEIWRSTYLRSGGEEFHCRWIRTPFIQPNWADTR